LARSRAMGDPRSIEIQLAVLRHQSATSGRSGRPLK
jgi:hypothetical protein